MPKYWRISTTTGERIADQIQWGGGSIRNFPGSPCAHQIHWGGGGVVADSRSFPCPSRFSGGGGGSGRHFPGNILVQVTQIPSVPGQFFYISGPPQRNDINSLQKKNIYQKFGGGNGPPGYATGYNIRVYLGRVSLGRVQ